MALHTQLSRVRSSVFLFLIDAAVLSPANQIQDNPPCAERSCALVQNKKIITQNRITELQH